MVRLAHHDVKKIWLVCAMKGEWSPLKRTLDGKSVKPFQVGIGTHHASESFRSILKTELEKPDLIIHFGISGGLIPGLHVGEVILCDSVVNLSGDRIDLSRGMQKIGGLLNETGPIRTGRLFSSEKILYSPSEKKEAGLATGATVVDLETFPVAQQAEANGIPFVAIRSISDPMEADLSDLRGTEFVGPTGDTAWRKIPGGLLKNPHLLLHLPKYQSSFHKATKTLSEAIIRLID